MIIAHKSCRILVFDHAKIVVDDVMILRQILAYLKNPFKDNRKVPVAMSD